MIRKAIYIALALLAAVALKAQEADFAERLKTVSAATETIECGFSLIRTTSFAAADILSEGRFYYLREAGISLDFTKPAGDQITMGRERFRIVSSGKTSVVKVDSNPMLRQLQKMLTACMTGDIEALKEGSELTFKDNGADFIVTITPSDRRAGKMVKLITLTFEKQNMSLTTLRMEEASGDVSQYRFFNKKFNGKVDPARFEVK